MFDILAIGELLIDFTPIKNEEGIFFKQNPGGAPCNMLAMAQALGSKTAFIGKVGNDQFGKTLKETLVSKGIHTEGLILSDKENTTLAFVHLTDSGDRSFSFYRDGCADVMLEEADINYSLIDQSEVVHFGSLSFTNEPSRTTVEKVIQYAKSKGKIISYDPNYRPALWADKTSALLGMKIGLQYADIIKVSDEEALLITGENTIEAAAKSLHDEGITLICVTLGSEGCYYHHNSGCGRVDGFISQVVDTTGAGDAFFGATVHQLIKDDYKSIEKEALEAVLSLSNAAASLVIEELGGIPAIPCRDAVLKRLQSKK